MGLFKVQESAPAPRGGRVASRFVPDSPLEGTGFEPSVPRQEKWSMPSFSDQTRVGRTLTLGGGAESFRRAETSNSRSRQRQPYFAL